MAERTMSAEAAIGQGEAWSFELRKLGCRYLDNGKGTGMNVKDANGANVLSLIFVPGVGGFLHLYDTALIRWEYGPGETAVPRANNTGSV